MPVKQFNDTSSVSVAYAFDNGITKDELSATELNLIPFTSEGFSMSKENQTSAAITQGRRPNGSKNTSGSASGSVTTEFGLSQCVIDLLKGTMMNDVVEAANTTDGPVVEVLTDGEAPKFIFFEKEEEVSPEGTQKSVYQRYYGNLVNESTITLGDSEFATFQASTNAAFAEVEETARGAGTVADTRNKPQDYELIDSSNNIDNIVLRDPDGNKMGVTWTEATVTISNNVRQQPGLGYEFSAGMALGQVGATVSGTIYYMDSTVLNSHLKNSNMSMEITFNTAEGKITLHFPKLKAQAPEANSQSTNEDYTQSLTLNAEPGTVPVEGTDYNCVVAVVMEYTKSEIYPNSGSG